MTEVAFDFGAPALTNQDDATSYTLGVRFTIADALDVVGVQWRVPDTISPGVHVVALWSDAGSLLAFSDDFTPDPGDAGQLTTYYFTAPFAASAATAYRASVFTPGRYVATTSYTWPHTDAPLTATADNGYLRVGSAGFPNGESGNDANFHVSPVVETGAEEHEGTAALGLDLALAGAGRKVGSGLAGLGLSLSLAAAGMKIASGTASLGLNLALVAVGQKVGATIVPKPDDGTITKPSAGVVEVPRLVYP